MAHFKKEFKACNLRYLFKMNWHQGSFIKNVFVKALNFSIRNTYDPIDTIFLYRIATAIQVYFEKSFGTRRKELSHEHDFTKMSKIKFAKSAIRE